MSDEEDRRVEAKLFDSEVDGERYAEIGRKVCKLLSESGISEPEMVPFLGFYLAHVMDAHLNCDIQMFRNNMLEFGNFTIFIFGKMQEEGADDDDAPPSVTH